MAGDNPSSLRFFDACTLVGPWPRRGAQFDSVDTLLEQMRLFGIEKALVLHATAWMYDFNDGNRALDREIADHPELLPCYAALPFTTGEMPGPEQWERRLRAGETFVFRIFPTSHNFQPGIPRPGDLFEFAQERRIPLFVDIDEIDWRDLWALCGNHPDLRLVIGNSATSAFHGIYREFRNLFEFLQRFHHVTVETSMLIGFRGIEEIYERYGPRRLVFATRMPFLEPGSAVARLQYAQISEEARRLIASGNLEAMIAEVIR